MRSSHQGQPSHVKPRFFIARSRGFENPLPGVGPVVAACYVLTLDSPQAMKTNRQAGALRSLLVQSAQYILGRFGPDSELRRWGDFEHGPVDR